MVVKPVATNKLENDQDDEVHYWDYQSQQGHGLEMILEDQAWLSLKSDEGQTFFADSSEAGLLALDQVAVNETINSASKSPHRLAVVMLSNDESVQELNKTYRGKDKPTNVLSFPSTENFHETTQKQKEPVHVGDIILAYETVINEAKRDKKPIKQHFSHLVIHGVLHLLGYDHENETQAQVMEALESELMNQLGYDDPYLFVR